MRTSLPGFIPSDLSGSLGLMTDHAFLFMGMGLRQPGHGMAAETALLHIMAPQALFQLGKKRLMIRVTRHIRPELLAGAEHHNKQDRDRATGKSQVFSR